MQPITVEQLHAIIGGRLCVAPAVRAAVGGMPVEKVVTDSRTAARGDVFWALEGPRYDGADFSTDAFQRGASGAVVARYVEVPAGCWAIQVDDSLSALHALAAWQRRQFAGRVVAVTGSVGKTTTRQMIHAVLGTRFAGWASPKNYNNHVGLPLSLLGLTAQHEYAVLELAANRGGQIGQLARLCAPQVGVVTCVADAHLGGFGSPEAVADAKFDLARAIPATGTVVLNGDDARLRKLAAGLRGTVVWVGRSLDCDVQATAVRYSDGRLELVVDGQRLCVPVWGRHHVTGVLAAVALGRWFGCPARDIARGLAGFQPPPLRCQVMQLGGATVINDTYNASPTAVRAALELLREFDAAGRRIAVVGDMRELGQSGPQWHRQIGREVVTRCGADLLVACGEHAADLASGAQSAGMPGDRIVACRTPDEAVAPLASLRPGDVALVKGSRSLGLERVVAAAEAAVLRRAA